MDPFKVLGWLYAHRRKIRIISHIALMMAVLRVALAFTVESYFEYRDLSILTLILQMITFAVIQTLYADEEE